MSNLEDLEKELYGANAEKLDRSMRKKWKMGEFSGKLPKSWMGSGAKKATSTRVRRSPKDFSKFFWWAAAVFVLAVLGLAAWFYFGGRGQEVKLDVAYEEPLESGKAVTIPFTYRNISKSVLEDTELSIVFPSGTKLVQDDGSEKQTPPRIIKKLGTLPVGEEQKTEINVRLFGREGEDKLVMAIFSYRPSSLRARFSIKASRVLTIERVPLEISWEAPEKALSGQEVEIKVRYISEAEQSFENLSLQINYPPGFVYLSSEPKPDIGEGIWKIDKLEIGQEGEVVVRGKLGGEEDEVKSFRASLGIFDERSKELNSYGESIYDIKIAPSPLMVEGLIDGKRDRIISPGEALNFSIRYKNNTESSLRNISVKAFLESSPYVSGVNQSKDFLPSSGRNILDISSVSAENGGVFDSQIQAVVWSPGNLSALKEIKSGEEGELNFSVLARDSFPMKSNKDKNLVLRLRSIIETSSVPEEFGDAKSLVYEDRLDLKSSSKIIFNAKSLFRSSLLIANSGPMPPKVGEKTTYTIHWEVRNFTNDLQGAEIRATMPANVKWENIISPSGTKLSFDKSSGEVLWIIGSLPAGKGVLDTALVGAFQISIIPSEADVGKTVKLLNQSIFSATDTFTNGKITAESGTLTTELKEDSTTSFNDWRVVE
ncbi:MAG: hypothetical protein Q8R29_03645 [bacterium]|nr:hypothetical protein [bacterium]